MSKPQPVATNFYPPIYRDARTTERLTRAGAILGIDVLDHIICGSDNYYSFAVAGRMGAKDYE
jgi:DNA repair protein RadC